MSLSGRKGALAQGDNESTEQGLCVRISIVQLEDSSRSQIL